MPDPIFVHRDASPPAGPGPLSEVEVLIQPNLAVRGWECGAGSVALGRFVPPQDAAAVEKLKAAGARITGSVRMAELGLGLDGDRMAAALTQGLAQAAVMTDLMGEARCVPWRRCLGFKPSYGLISRFDGTADPSMESGRPPGLRNHRRGHGRPGGPGPTILPRDATLLPISVYLSYLNCQGGRDLGEPAGLSPDESKRFEQELARLDQLNTHAAPLDFPDYELFAWCIRWWAWRRLPTRGNTTACATATGPRTPRTGEMYLQSRAESFGLLIKSFLFQGAYFQFQNYPAFENACRIRGRLLQQAQALFENVDVLIAPLRSASTDAAEESSLEKLYDHFEPALPANVLGFPALAMTDIDPT